MVKLSLSSYDNSLLELLITVRPPTCRYPSCHLDCVERLKVNWTILTIPVPSSFVQISKTRACGEQGRADRTHPSLAPPRHRQPPATLLSSPPALHHNLKIRPGLTWRLQPQPTLTRKMSGSQAHKYRAERRILDLPHFIKVQVQSSNKDWSWSYLRHGSSIEMGVRRHLMRQTSLGIN